MHRSFFIIVAALLLAAPAAQACQLICMKTNQTYSGNLGGLSGADAKCALEFPGFKFARSTTIIANLPNGGTTVINSGSPKIYAAVSSPGNAAGGAVVDVTTAVNAGGYTNAGSAVNGVAATPTSASSTIVSLGSAWAHGPGGGDCATWSNGTAGVQGPATQPASSSFPPCSTTMPLLCCNM